MLSTIPSSLAPSEPLRDYQAATAHSVDHTARTRRRT